MNIDPSASLLKPCAPLLKWPGGKRSELPQIRTNIPPHRRYFEPFFGGGSVFFDSIHVPSYGNDLHPDLIMFYRFVKHQDTDFFALLFDNVIEWERGSAENRSVMYYECRSRYNSENCPHTRRAVDFFLLRELAYGGMFRVNSNGHFNVPFGHAYAKNKNLRNKVEHLKAVSVLAKMCLLEVSSLDFCDFLNGFEFYEDDFMFVDPPYDSSFSKYDQNDFNEDDQRRLADYLASFNGRFMLVCKYTPLVESLYIRKGYSIRLYPYNYKFNIKGRFPRSSIHAMIANYELNL